MFHSFHGFEQETEDIWKDEEDPWSQLIEKVDQMTKQVEVLNLKRKVDQLENQLKNLQSMRREESKNDWRESENFSNLTGFHGPQDDHMDHGRFVWRKSEATTHAHNPYTHYMDHAPINREASNSGMDRLRHQHNVVNNEEACGEEWRYETTMQPSCDGMRSVGDDLRFACDINREAFNYGLTNNSYFSLYNQSSMSQPDSRSTFFSETYNSQSFSQMSSEALLFEEFMVNQTKHNEKIFEQMKSLSSTLETLMTKQTCSSYVMHNEHNDLMTLQSDEELKSFSSFDAIETLYETNSDESTQIETNEEQEKIEEPKNIASLPNTLLIAFPLGLEYIDKSNELELKHPSTGSTIDEFEKKKDDDTILKVEASDTKNNQFTKIDLSPQLEKCLENLDAMMGNTQQIKHCITIEPRKMTFKEKHTKHISRVLLNHFWVNYDALTGRKVKIR